MGRYFDHQQAYINDLQAQLNVGVTCKEEIVQFWPNAEADFTWKHTAENNGSVKVFQIKLRGYGHVWGEHEDEHMAWTLAKRALESTGVMDATVFQKTDRGEE